MLLQRLKADPKIGLNYDHMGYAEFEFGATRKSRLRIASLLLERKLTMVKARFFDKWGMSTFGPVDVYVFGSKEGIAKLGMKQDHPSVPFDLLVRTEKSPSRADNLDMLGWMSVRTDEPVLIVRATPDNIERADKFIKMFEDGILSDEEDAKKRTLYTFSNGWMMAREDGLWVLRNEASERVDSGMYFAPLLDVHSPRIGDPTELED
jgi:hypothetical protein